MIVLSILLLMMMAILAAIGIGGITFLIVFGDIIVGIAVVAFIVKIINKRISKK